MSVRNRRFCGLPRAHPQGWRLAHRRGRRSSRGL